MTAPRIVSTTHRKVWAAILLLALGQAAALVAGVAGTRLAFTSLDRGSANSASLAKEGLDQDGLHKAALDGIALPHSALWLIFASAVALAVLRPALRLVAEGLGQAHTADLRRSLLERAMTTAPAQIAQRRRGHLMLRLTGDMTTFKDGLARSLPPVVQAIALIPAAVAVLFWVDGRFGLGGMGVAAVSLGGATLSAPRLRRHHAALRRERARLAADMAERLPIAPDLARLGRRQRELSLLARTTETLARAAQTRLAQAEALRALPGASAGVLAVFVLWDGSARGLAAGEIAAALAALGVLAQTLLELAAAFDRLAGWRVARESLERALAPKPSNGDPRARVRLSGRHLTFAVDADAGLVVPAWVHVPPGGRATLFATDPDRLLRALTGQTTDPGIRVALQATPLPALTPGTLRRSIAVLAASPVVLKGSVRRNLCLGLTDRPTDRILHGRIAAAGLEASLDTLGGLDGRVSEGARALSAEQRLRMSALQMAVQRPAVLIVMADPAAMPAEVALYLQAARATVLNITTAPILP